jgi:alginate O-acetyltransferase complex protein AlgI
MGRRRLKPGTLYDIFKCRKSILIESLKKLVELTRINKVPFIHKCVQVAFTFCLVTFAWIFFRANSIEEALYIIRHLFTDIGKITNMQYLVNSISGMALTKFQLIVCFIGIITVEGVHLLQRKGNIIDWLSEKPAITRWAVYSILVTATFWLAFSENKQFIYFQF